VTRRDKLGRRIGHNWWREYVTTSWWLADQAWQAAREAAAIGYATEEREYAQQHPRPTLKACLVALAGTERNY
jgi:hypothetical protein